MLFRFNLIIIYTLLLSSHLSAEIETVKLSGRVIDQKGEAVPHAVVWVNGKRAIAVDEQGQFQWQGNEELPLRLLTQAMGYEQKNMEIFSAEKEVKIVLKEKAARLNEVVVSATRSQRSVADLPMPVQVVNRQQIQETGAMRITDLLREQAGLQIVADHGTGLQMQGLSSDYIMILLDGEPLIGRSAGTFDLDRLSISNIERIEILRGPSSSIYGSEAMAGVINIITRKSGKPFGVDIDLRYRSFNSIDAGLTSYINMSDWHVSLYFNRYSTSGFDLTPDTPGKTAAPYTSYTSQLKLAKRLNDKWKFQWSGRMYHEEQENVMLVNGRNENELIEMYAGRRELNSFPQLTFKPGQQLSFTLRAYSSYFDTETEDHFASDGELFADSFFRQLYHRNELQSDWQINASHMLTLGTGHLYETAEADRYSGENEFGTHYLFAQHQWDLSSQINIVNGARADFHNQFGSRLSPKISGLYKITDKFSWQASIGFGFKTPDFRQLLLNFNNPAIGYYVFGANNLISGLEQLAEDGLILQQLWFPEEQQVLNAETSWSLNTGFRYRPLHNLSLSTNFYRNEISNMIETAPVARLTNGQQAFSYFNISRVYTQGMELEADWQINKSWRLAMGYTYLDAKDKDVLDRITAGELYKRDSETNRTRRLTKEDYGGLFNRSRHSGNIKLNYLLTNQGLNVALRGIYRGSFGFGDINGNLILDDKAEYADGMMLWNLSISKDIGGYLRLEAGGNNLLNQLNIYEPTNPGRTFFIGLQTSTNQLFNK